MLIQDLSKELDTKALSALRGGNNGTAVDNTVGQVMNLSAPIAVLSGGPSNTNVAVSGSQYGTICSTQYAGDTFALLGGCFRGYSL